MEKANFDEIVRSLMVYLKGQIPSLQTKSSHEELTKQIHNIGSFLRNSISQLEAAAYYDPRGTKEYKELQAEKETFKKNNQRLEESLFLEMSKTQKFASDIEKLKAELDLTKANIESQAELIKVSDQRIAEYQVKANKLQTELTQLQSEVTSRKDQVIQTKEPLENSLKAIQLEKQNLGMLVDKTHKEVSFLNDQLNAIQLEKQNLGTIVDKAHKEISHLNEQLKTRDADMGILKEKIKSLELSASLDKNIQGTLETDLEREKLVSRRLFNETNELKNLNNTIEDQKKTIFELTTLIEKQKRELNSSTSAELIKNIQASYEAKIAFLEKTMSEAKKKTAEKDVSLERLPEKIEPILREKLQLEQRVVDLEATIRRFSSNRAKAQKEEGKSPFVFGPDECVLFFELFSCIGDRMAKSLEFSEIRFKAEEALGILLKTHSIEPIPALGYSCIDNLHKPVQSFISTLFDDGTIVREISRGFRFQEHVIQRSNVWVIKNKFKCTSCATTGRPQDSFCPKCGLELCAPEGTPKRKLLQLPSTLELGIPLLDSLIKQENIQKAEDFLNFLSNEHAENPSVQKRRQIIANLRKERNT